MAFDFKAATPDTSIDASAFMLGADTQASANPSIYQMSVVKTFMSLSPTLVTPTLGVAAGTSLALGGATIGSNALAVTGTSLFTGSITAENQIIYFGATGYIAQGTPASGTSLIGLDASNLVTLLQNKLAFGGDAFLTKIGAATLQLGAADAASPVAQTLSTQGNTTTNGNGVTLTIKAGAGDGSGTGGALYLDGGITGAAGTGGAIIFRTAPAAAGGTLATALTINSSGGIAIAANGSASVTNCGFASLSTTDLSVYTSSTRNFSFNSTTFYALGTSPTIALLSDTAPSIQLGASSDVILTRDAANTLALRNGTNAQTFNVYNTYTSSTSYERLSTYVSSNVFYLESQQGSGGGTARPVRLSSGDTPGGNGGYLQVTPQGTFEFAKSGTSIWWSITANGNFGPGRTLATNMTHGFMNMVGAAGAPSGVPSDTTGFPFYYDSTNNKIYVYNGSWRSTAALT